MRWWPFGRESSPSAEVGSEPAVAVERARSEWQRIPPLRTVVSADPRVTADEPWRTTLPSTWTVPSSLQPLAHDVSPSAPRGLVPSLLAPVEGYADAPELRWPSIVEDAPDAEPAWAGGTTAGGRT